MRRMLAAVTCAVALWMSSPSPAQAWGLDVHRFIADRAIAHLPAEIRPFYEKNRTFLVEHSIDPDLWRAAGFEQEPPRHFTDLDAYGAYPFTALPRDYELAVAKFGREKVEKNGTLPWRVGEIQQQLVKSFTQHRNGTSPYALENAKFFSAVLAHYVGDAHVPFHAILNYDGQLTNQHGIHSRFESALFDRYHERLRIEPPRVEPVKAPVDFIFDALLSGFKLTDGILAADREAIGTGEVYDDAYFDRFFERTKPALERRLSEAIAGVAAVITGAWEAAGRPELPLERRAPVLKRRTTSQP